MYTADAGGDDFNPAVGRGFNSAGFDSAPQALATAGTALDYRLRLHGVPFRWRTVIETWEPPHYFHDTQARGPYRLWQHEHFFEPEGEGATVIRDRLRYALPLGPLGVQVARVLRKDGQDQLVERVGATRRLELAEPLSQPVEDGADPARRGRCRRGHCGQLHLQERGRGREDHQDRRQFLRTGRCHH